MRPAGPPLDGGDKCCRFTADERTGTRRDPYIKRETRAEDLLAEEAVFPGLADGDPEAAYGERVLGADIDQAFGSPHGIRTYDHALDEHVGVALHLVPVHVGPGVALVGIADDILLIGLCIPCDPPLQAGGKPGAAPAAEPGHLHLFYDGIRVHAGQSFLCGGIPPDRDILVDILGVDQAGVPEHHFLLVRKERDILVGGDDPLKPLAVSEGAPRHVVP